MHLRKREHFLRQAKYSLERVVGGFKLHLIWDFYTKSCGEHVIFEDGCLLRCCAV
jgi:hypothetical protein